jgi:hypothetical protein
MEDEIEVIEKNKTWKLVDIPQDKEIISVKWIYKIKYNENCSIQRNKTMLVAKGYSQQLGVDFHETFAPVARLETMRALISLESQNGWLLYQLDVKSAFLNGEVKEEVYVDWAISTICHPRRKRKSIQADKSFVWAKTSS